LTDASEGRARGGGGSILRFRQAGGANPSRLCGVCRTSGHNRTTCPLNLKLNKLNQ
jgi:hypothetical protein